MRMKVYIVLDHLVFKFIQKNRACYLDWSKDKYLSTSLFTEMCYIVRKRFKRDFKLRSKLRRKMYGRRDGRTSLV